MYLKTPNLGIDAAKMFFEYMPDETKSMRKMMFKKVLLNSVYNDYVYNDIPVIAISFYGPGHDASI